MAHTFSNLLTHVIFSTKRRIPLIAAEIKNELHAYMGGIIRQLNGQPIRIDGTSDHVHLLLRLPPDVSVSETLRILKTNSSRWVHERWPSRRAFGWQAGYSAFSVSQSNASKVLKYITSQEEHHRRVSFEEEFLAFLKKHRIQYDKLYLWD